MVRIRPSVIFLPLALVALCLFGLRAGLSQSTVLRRVTTTTEDGININPSLSGDGRRIVFESTEDLAHAGGATSFRALRADISGDPAAFIQLGATRSPAPGISQDGSRIAFAANDDPLGTNADHNSEIFFFDGAALRQVTNTSPGDASLRARNGNFQPSLSDDARFIAFHSNRDLANSNADANFEIYLYDTTTQAFAQLTSTVGIVGSTDAKISGNGAQVAYIRDNSITAGGSARDLVLQPRAGGASRVIAASVNNLLLTFGRAISDDGTRVVYSNDSVPGTSQVYVFDGRSNATRQITQLAAPLVTQPDIPLRPTISGDGSRLAFATRRTVTGFANTDRSIELYVFDIPTGQFSRVTDAPSTADGYVGTTLVAEVISSLNDDGSIVAFNFPRTLSGPVTDTDVQNNSEIYVTATAPRPPFGTLTVLNGASFGNEPATTEAVAPDSIAVAQGGALSNSTVQGQRQSDGTFPRTLGGTTVTVNGRAAQLFFVSPSQVNFLVPPETETGTAEVVVTNSDGFQSRGSIIVLRAAPGVFTYSGDGQGEGVILDAATLQPGPFDPTGGNLRLIIFSTGVRNAQTLTVTIGGRATTVESVMASPDMPGLDEVHILVPSDLRGAGTVDLVIRADNRDSNPVQLTLSGEARHDIVINEVLADPPGSAATDLIGDANHDGARDSSNDEFVELVNASGHDIDISGFQLFSRSSGATSDTLRHTFAAGTIATAGRAIVVFGGGNPNPSDPIFGGALVLKASTGGLLLANGGGFVTLKEPNGTLVQIFSYGGSTGLNGDANQSLTRSPDAGDNSPGGNFVPHTTAPGSAGRAFSPGTRVDGTPFGVRPIGFIIVSPSSATIVVGGHQQFTARAFDPNTNEIPGVIFTWTSSDPSVASIDQNGLATGLAPGTTSIRASARGTQSGPATLTVNDVQRVLTRIDLTPASATIPVSGTQQFTARAFDQNNNEITGTTFTWASSDPTVATIDQNGLATGLSPGATFITASSGSVTSNQATLNVVPATFVINEVLADPPGSAATDLIGDANHDGTRSAGDDEFVEMVNSSSATLDITGWTIHTRSTTSGAAEILRHVFAANTTLAAGTAVVVFGGGNFDPANSVFGCARVVKASISGGLSLTNGGLTVIVRDAAGNLVTQFAYGAGTGLNGDNDQSLTRSPDISGAFVQHTAAAGANGRRFSPGTRVDGAPFGNCPGQLTSVTIAPPSSSVVVGQTTQFTAQAFDQFGRAMTNATITFASSDTNIATVDSVTTDPATGIATATVTGRNVGTAQITATATDGATTITSAPATLNVTPVPQVITRIDVTPASATINRGQNQQFTAQAFDQNNQPVSGITFTWSSSNTAVATVDSNGLAHGIGIGTATITASAADGNGGTISGQATLNVQVPLVINEILADPPGSAATDLIGDANRDGTRDSDDDEFVELVNNSTAPVDISGVIIADMTSNRFTFPANTTLAAGRAVVIFGGGSPPANDPAFGGALIFTTGTLSLNNGGDTVTVKLPVSGVDVPIATQTYGSEGGEDQSLTRSPDLTGAFVKHAAAPNADGRVYSPGTRVDGTPFNSPALTRIEITPASASINVGQTQAFTARAFSNTGGPEVEVFNVSFIWDSSDPTKATVAPLTGMTTTATGIAAGTANIRARAGGQASTATLTINAVVASIELLPDTATVTVGNSQTFTATARDAVGNAIPGITFAFSLRNPSPANAATITGTTLSTVTVRGDNPGTVTVVANYTRPGDGMLFEDTSLLTINPPPPVITRVDVTPTTATINRGQTTQFTAQAFDQNNQPVSGITFTWSSSNTAVATVDSNGLAHGIGIGTATITASAADGNGGTISGQATLNVQVLLVINELLADPPGSAATDLIGDANRDGTRDSDDDEFVELVNNSTAPVDISGVIIADAASNRFTFPANTTLAAGRAVVIFGGGSPPTNDPAFGGALIFTTGTLSLNNTGDTVTVKLPVSGVDVTIQAQTYGAEGNNDQSLTRSPDAEINSAGGSFVQHTTAPNAAGRVFSPGTRADGTPFGSPAITRIEVTPTTAAIIIGQTQSFTARAFSNAGGPEVEVSNVSFIWDSSDPTKATVAPLTGMTTTATGIAAGTTNIRARAGGQAATASLTVNALPTLSVNDVSLNEGNAGTTTFTFTVSLSAPAPAGGVTFDIATQDNTATVADNDYVARALSGQTIAAGQQTYTFDVTVNGDTAVEANETFFVNVTNVTGVTVADGQGLGTIQNDDSSPLPTLSVNDVSLNEGNAGTTTFTFTVSLSAPAPAGGVTFDIATADGTAQDGVPAGEDNDYVARSLTGQTIAAGQQTFTFDVTINGDKLVEPNDTFFVNVTNVTNAIVSDGQGLGTIQNDDAALLVISQIYGGGNNAGATFQNDFVEIFNRGTTTVNFAVTPYSVQYAAAAGSFTSGNKIDLTSGSLAPGQYFLIKLAGGTTNGAPLPTADATNAAINMSATDGKVALVVGTILLGGTGCPIVATVSDFVGYGSANCAEGAATGALNATRAARRTDSCTDTNVNSADFTIVTNPPAPRNSATAPSPCP
ncbi:MAG: hypothetical protein QOF02_726 [Blastocatellia bacterium]|nr:hypothetical protein [Blastocatellia bacterium]